MKPEEIDERTTLSNGTKKNPGALLICILALMVFAGIYLGRQKSADGQSDDSIAMEQDATTNTPAPPVTNRNTDLTFIVNGVSFTMKQVKAGSFMMGATAEQGDDAVSDEKPVHRVTLTRDYYMGEYEVTQELYEAVTGTNPSYYKDTRLPVENVNWDDADKFCQTLSTLLRQQGRNVTFRLPTEAEWEYAVRGGHLSPQQTKYAGSNIIENVAWYDIISGGATHVVGQKSPNALGLYDMSGNVWEWCSDWFGDYGSAAQTDPAGPSSGSYRVIRGGGWNGGVRYCRVSHRSYEVPSFCYVRLGFRLVCVPR